jgi:hypothetical protein
MSDLMQFHCCQSARTASQAPRRRAQVEILAPARNFVPLSSAAPELPVAWQVTHSGNLPFASNPSDSAPRKDASELVRRETLALLDGLMNFSEPQSLFTGEAALLRQGISSGRHDPACYLPQEEMEMPEQVMAMEDDVLLGKQAA